MTASRRFSGLMLASLLSACGTDAVKRPMHIVPGPALGDDTAAPDTGSQDDTGAPVHADRFELGAVVDCADPLDDVVYEEVAESMGLEPGQIDPGEHTEGGVAAVADFDQDGDLDIVMGYRMEPPILYTRDGDTFSRSYMPYEEDPVGLPILDADQDGRLDIVVARNNGAVLLNRPEGWTVALLPTPPEALGDVGNKGMVAGDLTGDGVPDLYAYNTVRLPDVDTARDHVLVNDGTGHFEARPDMVPEEFRLRHAFDAQLFDWDDDGDLDVYVVNELTEMRTMVPDLAANGSFLLENDAGTFRSANDACACELVVDGMGLDIGDGNRDGLPDIFIGATNGTWLIEMLEDHSFVDVTLVREADAIAEMGPMAWGVQYLDFDNDGLQDFLVAEGDLWHEFSLDPWVLEQPVELMRQVPGDTPSYEIVSEDYGFGLLGSWRTIVAMDHNHDGILDPLVTDVWRQPRLFMSQGCTANGWLEVEAPLSAKVELTSGGTTQTAWVSTHSSFGGSKAPIVHFGMGDADEVESLVVTLLGGERLVAPAPFAGRRMVQVK